MNDIRGDGYANTHGNADIRGDGYAHAGVKVKAAPDVQVHAHQQNVHIDPNVVDVHASNTGGMHTAQVHTGWVSSMVMDVQAERSLLDATCYGIIGFAAVVYVLLHFLPSAYGRYASRAFGVLIPARIAWFIQDLPAVIIPVMIFLYAQHTQLHLVNYILLGCFLLSYAQRALVYPLLIKGGKPMPSIPFFGALIYNTINAYIQARYLTRFAYYGAVEVISVHFLAGLLMFAMGMGINWQSDAILRSLRSPLSRGSVEVVASSTKSIGKVFDKDLGMHAAGPGGPMPSDRISASRAAGGSSASTGYQIPYGGMFDFVSCANFFGEIVEWWGFALASWSLPALAHAIFTTANLIPRALQHHQDYLNKFKGEYPQNRAAVIPFVL